MKAPSSPKLWQSALLALLFLPVVVSAQGTDYDAILRDATQRYRGDIPTHRHFPPLVAYRADEERRVKPPAPEPFAPQPFTLQTTLPASPTPRQ